MHDAGASDVAALLQAATAWQVHAAMPLLDACRLALSTTYNWDRQPFDIRVAEQQQTHSREERGCRKGRCDEAGLVELSIDLGSERRLTAMQSSWGSRRRPSQ